MGKSILLACSLLVMSVCASANELDQAFTKLNLKPLQAVSGKFEQAKKITVLKKELLSNGTFSADENGFVWQQLQPVKSQISLHNNQVKSVDHLGNEKQLAQAAQYIPLLQALLTQDAAKLSPFLTFVEQSEECLIFAPKPPLDTLYKSISLCGETQINSLLLVEQANHQTRISLTYDKQ